MLDKDVTGHRGDARASHQQVDLTKASRPKYIKILQVNTKETKTNFIKNGQRVEQLPTEKQT